MSAALVDASSLVAAFSDDPPGTTHCQSLFTTLMTLDVRDFSRYRLPDGRGFDIL